MIYLVLTVLIITSFFVIFKLFALYEVHTFTAVVLNYGVCVLTGLIYYGYDNTASLTYELDNIWYYAALLGVFFISGFYLMAHASQKVGMAMSTLASKLSMLIPIVVSLMLWNQGKEYPITVYLGLLLAIVSVFVITITGKKGAKLSSSNLVLLLLVLLTSGAVDGVLSYVNTVYNHVHFQYVFPIYAFLVAFILGSSILLVREPNQLKNISKLTLIGGTILGVINYFSLVVLMKTLSAFNHDASVVFPYINLSVIIVSTFIGVLVFKEKIDFKKMIGIVLAVVSIALISL